jgi:hypothetical protein
MPLCEIRLFSCAAAMDPFVAIGVHVMDRIFVIFSPTASVSASIEIIGIHE